MPDKSVFRQFLHDLSCWTKIKWHENSSCRHCNWSSPSHWWHFCFLFSKPYRDNVIYSDTANSKQDLLENRREETCQITLILVILLIEILYMNKDLFWVVFRTEMEYKHRNISYIKGMGFFPSSSFSHFASSSWKVSRKSKSSWWWPLTAPAVRSRLFTSKMLILFEL